MNGALETQKLNEITRLLKQETLHWDKPESRLVLCDGPSNETLVKRMEGGPRRLGRICGGDAGGSENGPWAVGSNGSRWAAGPSTDTTIVCLWPSPSGSPVPLLSPLFDSYIPIGSARWVVVSLTVSGSFKSAFLAPFIREDPVE